jgi:hypothetical protein
MARNIKTIAKEILALDAAEARAELEQRNWYGNDTLRTVIALRDGGSCAYCGLGIGEGTDEPVSLDHIHPQSKSGGHSPRNLVAVCRYCNSQKGAQTFERAFRPTALSRSNSRPDGRTPGSPSQCRREAERRASLDYTPALALALGLA